MDGSNCSVKKSTFIKEWMTQADPPKVASITKEMNDRSLLLSSNKMTHYFKEWTTPSGVLRKIYCLYKNLMLQIDPPNSSCPKNCSTPKEN